jgi:DEAD/DEAH box helicase domain-containing protein
MQSTYFASLLPELTTRAARATIGKLGFSNQPLRKHLFETFARGYGETGCFVADPVFEATFGWRQADTTMAALTKTLLHGDLVNAMDKPWGDNGKEYRFPRDAKPYVHQLKAWNALLAPGHQSVVVTSGTGSGKTECFMVPVLSSLAHAREVTPELRGVRALFLYPLNALIQSQRDRLRAWTGPFNGDIRFCLYNGMTPEEGKAENYRKAPNEVHDRATLRSKPPAILVTNPTMLEYMLVRAQDAPILEQSQGTLEWIVLDEAHNYIGSQAAELALLLRRVLHAFGTDAQKVHFIATSATIGSGDDQAKAQLQEFLAKLAGVDANRVVVVEGERQVPLIDARIDPGLEKISPSAIAEEATAEGRYLRLAAHPVARKLRDLFVPALSGQTYQSLSSVKHVLKRSSVAGSDASALEWVDLLTSATHGTGRDVVPFLPLRLHAFHNTLNGLWACASPSCGKKGTTKLADADWPFGMVYTDERRRCGCGGPVFPLISCNDCNETFLSAELMSRGGVRYLRPPIPREVDEFTLDRDPEEREPNDGEPVDQEEPNLGDRTPALIVNGSTRGAAISLNAETLEVLPKLDEVALALRVQDVALIDGRQVLKCPCCGGDEPLAEQFRLAMLGAPFLLGTIIPTLLEYCPDGDTPLDSPMRGRRMITFTDSRQGTARIAAQLQQDAERNALRSAVYRRLVLAMSSSAPELAEIKERLKNNSSVLQAIPAGSPIAQTVEKMIREDKEKLLSLAGGKPVPHGDLVQWLATQVPDISQWIHRYYEESDSNFRTGRGKELLTEILLCREFARRPKRQNSLETMGLMAVQYPKLDAVVTRRPAVEQAGLTLSEWKDFLKICLDFCIRQSFCLKLPASWERWGGNRVFSKQVLPPLSKEQGTSKLIKWPKVRPSERQHRLVRLLAYALKVDPQTGTGKDRIDSLLLAAWDDLCSTANLLQLGGGQGRYLDLADFAFQTMPKGWVCPVTRRVLDVTLRGATPYLPERQIRDDVVLCRPIEVPVCDVIGRDFASESEKVLAARAWVEAQPSLMDARIEGIWSNVNDRVIEGAGYFRAVEHSAQQSGNRLQQYEGQFKRGAINLMSCSTTMEMGVDIGGINTVAMNNVPPHPANYLQRAGRAGRRAETRSIALTVCKNNPHDQHVFRHTTWPFETRIATPGISLSSPLLVQRHVNSMLLSNFLRLQDKQGKLDKLTLDWWMLPRGSSRQERFVAWCECFDPEAHVKLNRGISALVKRTVLEGRGSNASLVGEVGQAAARHAAEWMAELEAIDDQITQLSAKAEEDRVPLKALQIQRKRLTGEYLLREFATSGFLPGYGFPTDITTFETLNKDSAELNQRGEASGREDNRYQRRELPSRDTVTALREYAPGASVVIDGLVYESAGITLNWHAPATLDQVNELQNIRQAWRCGHCGSSGTGVLASLMNHCVECGAELSRESGRSKQYLEPAGFSVDLYSQTHNDISLQKYVPVEAPWITAQGEWIALANPSLGAFRSSSEGSVFHYSSGLNGSGYAVCLECGRAAPMGSSEDSNDTPGIFGRPHKRLRGRRGGGDDWTCGGSESPFKIKKGVSFGREYTTDVLEISLIGLDGHPLVDPIAAYTLAVALRSAIADRLGIDESELGCDTKPVRDANGRQTRVIQIFDVRSGGYSSLVAADLPSLLSAARDALVCENHCESACQSCLLTFDTRFRLDNLDRHAALRFLTTEWVIALQLPSELQLFGDSSRAEYQPIGEAIARELNRTTATRLLVYLAGDPSDWDLAASPLRHLMHRLSVKSGIELCLVSTAPNLSGLAVGNSSTLQSLAAICNVQLRRGSPPPAQSPGICLASVEGLDGSYLSWGSVETSQGVPDQRWGIAETTPLIMAKTVGPTISNESVKLPQAASTGAHAVEVSGDLNGPGQGFGDRFWALVSPPTLGIGLPIDRSVVSISYEDRYLATPLSCALLVELISALKSRFEAIDLWRDPEVIVSSMNIEDSKIGRHRDQWISDWPSTELRDTALEAAFQYCGLKASVASKAKRELIHGRRLILRFDTGPECTLWMDQGLSYWTASRQQARMGAIAFPFGDQTATLGQRLAEIKVGVEGHGLPTQIFLSS